MKKLARARELRIFEQYRVRGGEEHAIQCTTREPRTRKPVTCEHARRVARGSSPFQQPVRGEHHGRSGADGGEDPPFIALCENVAIYAAQTLDGPQFKSPTGGGLYCFRDIYIERIK